jgi:hypothetical protein
MSACPRKVTGLLGLWAEMGDEWTKHPKIIPTHTTCLSTPAAFPKDIVSYLQIILSDMFSTGSAQQLRPHCQS